MTYNMKVIFLYGIGIMLYVVRCVNAVTLNSEVTNLAYQMLFFSVAQ